MLEPLGVAPVIVPSLARGRFGVAVIVFGLIAGSMVQTILVLRVVLEVVRSRVKKSLLSYSMPVRPFENFTFICGF